MRSSHLLCMRIKVFQCLWFKITVLLTWKEVISNGLQNSREVLRVFFCTRVIFIELIQILPSLSFIFHLISSVYSVRYHLASKMFELCAIESTWIKINMKCVIIIQTWNNFAHSFIYNVLWTINICKKYQHLWFCYFFFLSFCCTSIWMR